MNHIDALVCTACLRQASTYVCEQKLGVHDVLRGRHGTWREEEGEATSFRRRRPCTSAARYPLRRSPGAIHIFRYTCAGVGGGGDRHTRRGHDRQEIQTRRTKNGPANKRGKVVRWQDRWRQRHLRPQTRRRSVRLILRRNCIKAGTPTHTFRCASTTTPYVNPLHFGERRSATGRRTAVDSDA